VLTFGIRSLVPATLEPIHYTCRQRHKFGAMDPNIKLVIEEIAKIRVEIKEGFDAQEASFTKRLDEALTAYQLHDTRVANLEDTVVTFDKSFSEWRLEVDSSISVVKLELSKLNTYFVREAKAVGVATQGVPTNVPTPSSSTATDVPNGHSIESSHRDCGFGRVFTQIHDPVKGTMLPPPPPEFSLNVESPTHDSTKFAHPHHSDFTVHLGQLPKMHFPKFQGDNPKLWQSRCENYFDMYSVDPHMWVCVATMHFEGPAARWLQSVNHRTHTPTWTELCSCNTSCI
jgi:hypothetical protein